MVVDGTAVLIVVLSVMLTLSAVAVVLLFCDPILDALRAILIPRDANVSSEESKKGGLPLAEPEALIGKPPESRIKVDRFPKMSKDEYIVALVLASGGEVFVSQRHLAAAKMTKHSQIVEIIEDHGRMGITLRVAGM